MTYKSLLLLYEAMLIVMMSYLKLFNLHTVLSPMMRIILRALRRNSKPVEALRKILLKTQPK